MYKRNGFTLLEVLISLGLSSVVFLGIMYAYNISFTNLDRARTMLDFDHRVGLINNQLERDISAAFIPWDLSTTRTASQEKKTAQKTDENYFVITTQDSETTKLRGEKVAMLKELSCVTTGPLLFWKEHHRPRLVKVTYRLLQDKNKNKQAPVSYSLWREEWPLQNTHDSAEAQAQEEPKPLRASLVAQRLKGVYCECFYPVANKEQLAGGLQPPQIQQTVTWGDTQETQNSVPQYIVVKIECWDDAYKISFFMRFSIPVLYHTLLPDNDDVVTGGGESAQPKSAQAPPVGPTPAGNQPAPVSAGDQANAIQALMDTLQADATKPAVQPAAGGA